MRLLAMIANFLIGWHQGGQTRHRRAELAWRARLERWQRTPNRDLGGRI